MKRFFCFRFIVLFGFLFVVRSVSAQEKYWLKPDSLFRYVQPVASFQFFSTYTMGEKAQLQPGGQLEAVEDRLNFSARRARIGFKGTPYERINYVLMVQYDNTGRDRYSGVRGSVNTGQLGILDSYITWRLTRTQIASVTIGYFHPQFSRECITGDLLVNSFDKSISQGYVRQHLVGKGYGRSTGINLGGIKDVHGVELGFNVGLFNNNTTASDSKATPETAGKHWSPLLVERFTVTFGDPEKKKYSINYGQNNHFNKRKGVTIGFNHASQGKTDIFDRNAANGVDLLLNIRNINFDCELNMLERHSEGTVKKSQTGHVRLGYNLVIARTYFIEPTFSMTKFHGEQGNADWGVDQVLDAGVNWYLNRQNLKLSLHYILQQGSGDNGYSDGSTFKMGDFIGVGFLLII